jgi:hypothetical protein
MTAETILGLDGIWSWVADPDGTADRQGWLAQAPRRGMRAMPVPGVWQRELPDYHGPAVYYRRIRVPTDWCGRRVFLKFEGANYLTRVYLDGALVGEHEGGYVAFELEITRFARPGAEQQLAVWILHAPPGQNVNGLDLCDVASSKETWYYPYAGLWGGVTLESRPAAFVADLTALPNLARRCVNVSLVVDGVAAIDGDWWMRDDAGRPCASGSFTTRGTRRRSEAVWRVAVAQPRAWSPSDPHRYSLEVRLANGEGRIVRFGMRDVRLHRHGLLLNGEPTYVRGILLQPNYPESLIHAPDEAFARREMRLVREGGFNLVRAHLKPMHPAALDEADALGLLVYEESALAWIRRGPQLLPRARREMAAMIRRDRNHPSVVMWGVLNESVRADRKIRRSIFRLAGALDPTRPVIGNSGAVALAPGGGWSGETLAMPGGRQLHPAPFEDVHIYARAPVPDGVFEFLRVVGNPRRMAAPQSLGLTPDAWIAPWLRRLRRTRPRFLLSEYGYGGIMDYARAVRRFRVRQGQDARQYAEFADALATGFRERGLRREFGSLARFILQAQQVQANGCRLQTAAIRLNPTITGYVLTQLNDVGWESSAGILDVWREPKPVYAAMQEANRPVIGVVQPERANLRDGQAVKVRAWVVCDRPTQPLRLRAALRDSRGKLLGRAEWPVPTKGRIRSVGVASLGRAPSRGPLRLEFELRERGRCIHQGRAMLAVVPAAVAFDVPADGVTQLGAWRVVREAASLSPVEVRSLLRQARAGASVLLCGLTPTVLEAWSKDKLLPWPLKAVPGAGAFVGQFHYLRREPEFLGLSVGDVANPVFAEVLPDWTLREVPGARILAGAFTVSTFTVPGDKIRHRGQVDWLVGIMDLPCGKGRVRISQWKLWLQDPMSRLLQERLLQDV